MDESFFQGSGGSEPPMTQKRFSEEVLDAASLKDVVAFDIETYSPGGFPHNAEDPVVNYSLVAPLKKGGLFAISAIGSPKTEADLLRLPGISLGAFNGFYLLTYNGAEFDVEYAIRRSRIYGLDLREAFDARRHIDVYQLVRWLGVELPRYSQKTVEKALGIKRAFEDVSGRNHHTIYRNFIDAGDLTPLFYNLEDSFGCLRIIQKISKLCLGVECRMS